MKAELYFERALINVAAWGMCVYSRETKVGLRGNEWVIFGVKA